MRILFPDVKVILTFNLILGQTWQIWSSIFWDVKLAKPLLFVALWEWKMPVWEGSYKARGRHFLWAGSETVRETGTWKSMSLFNLWAKDFLHEFEIDDWWQETGGELGWAASSSPEGKLWRNVLRWESDAGELVFWGKRRSLGRFQNSKVIQGAVWKDLEVFGRLLVLSLGNPA